MHVHCRKYGFRAASYELNDDGVFQNILTGLGFAYVLSQTLRLYALAACQRCETLQTHRSWAPNILFWNSAEPSSNQNQNKCQAKSNWAIVLFTCCFDLCMELFCPRPDWISKHLYVRHGCGWIGRASSTNSGITGMKTCWNLKHQRVWLFPNYIQQLQNKENIIWFLFGWCPIAQVYLWQISWMAHGRSLSGAGGLSDARLQAGAWQQSSCAKLVWLWYRWPLSWSPLDSKYC